MHMCTYSVGRGRALATPSLVVKPSDHPQHLPKEPGREHGHSSCGCAMCEARTRVPTDCRTGHSPRTLPSGCRRLLPWAPQLFQGPTPSTCNQGTARSMSRTAVAASLGGGERRAARPTAHAVFDHNVGGAQAVATLSIAYKPPAHPLHFHTAAGKGYEPSCFGCTVCGCECMRALVQGQATAHAPCPPGAGACHPGPPSSSRDPPPAPATKAQPGA